MTSISVQSKGLEEALFHEICYQLAKQNRNYSLKEVLKDKVYVLVDPVNNTTILHYEDTSDATTKNILRSYSEKKLLQILSDFDLRIDPMKKRIVIADTAAFFSRKFSYRISGVKYRTISNTNKKCSAYIFKARIKDDKIHVAIAVSGTDDVLIFSFTYVDGNLKFFKKSLGSTKPHYG
jgi:hypothetical protein